MHVRYIVGDFYHAVQGNAASTSEHCCKEIPLQELSNPDTIVLRPSPEQWGFSNLTLATTVTKVMLGWWLDSQLYKAMSKAFSGSTV